MVGKIIELIDANDQNRLKMSKNAAFIQDK